MQRIPALAALVLVLACGLAVQPEEASAKTLAGRCVAVADGDTITVLVGKTQHKIRVASIDAPERGQPFDNRAKQFTGDLVFGKAVSVNVITADKYGRTVGRVILPDGRDLSVELARAGLAWWYRKYAPDDKELAALEQAARAARVGLWVDPKPIPPWDWRAVQRAKRTAQRTPQEGSGKYWLNTKSNARHNSTCKWFRKTKQGRPCRANEGRACKICGG